MTDESITQEQVEAYMARQAAAKQAEEKRIWEELQGWLRDRNARIVCVIQAVDGGSAAIPMWGIEKL